MARLVSAWRRGGVATSAAVSPEVLPQLCNGPTRCCAAAPFPCIPARMHYSARQAVWPRAAVPPVRRRPATYFDVPCMSGPVADHILHPYDGTRRSAAMLGPGNRKRLRVESGLATAAASGGGGGLADALEAGVAPSRAPLRGRTGLDAGGEELQRPGRGKRSRNEGGGLAIADQAGGAAHLSAPPVGPECVGDDAFVGMVRVCRCGMSCRTRGRCVGAWGVLLCMLRRVSTGCMLSHYADGLLFPVGMYQDVVSSLSGLGSSGLVCSHYCKNRLMSSATHCCRHWVAACQLLWLTCKPTWPCGGRSTAATELYWRTLPTMGDAWCAACCIALTAFVWC